MDSPDQYLAQKAEVALRRQDRRGFVDAADLTMARALRAKERRYPLLEKASQYYKSGNHHDRAAARLEFGGLLNSLDDSGTLGDDYEDALTRLRSTRLYPWDIPSESLGRVAPEASKLIARLDALQNHDRARNLAAATIAYRAGLYENAEQHIHQAIRDLDPEDDQIAPFAVAWAHTLLGSNPERVPESQPALDSAQRVAVGKNDLRQIGKIILLQGIILERVSPSRAIRHYEHHAESLSEEFPFESALLRKRLGPLLSLSEERVQAQMMGNELLDASTDPRIALRAFMLADYYEKLSLEHTEEAFTYYSGAIEAAQRFGQNAILGWALIGASRTAADSDQQRQAANDAYDVFVLAGDAKGLRAADQATRSLGPTAP